MWAFLERNQESWPRLSLHCCVWLHVPSSAVSLPVTWSLWLAAVHLIMKMENGWQSFLISIQSGVDTKAILLSTRSFWSYFLSSPPEEKGQWLQEHRRVQFWLFHPLWTIIFTSWSETSLKQSTVIKPLNTPLTVSAVADWLSSALSQSLHSFSIVSQNAHTAPKTP